MGKCKSGSAANMTCVSSAVKCLSVLLLALSVIFFINFVIISLLTGVEPRVRCYHQDYDSYYHSTYSNHGVNFWEGLWIPIPSFVTGIIGLTTGCGPTKCKKWALMATGILTTIFNLAAFAPLVLSYLVFQRRRCEHDSGYSSGSGSGGHYHYDGPVDESDFDMRVCYLFIQIGLVFVLSSTSLALSILTCPYKPTPKTNPGTVLPGVQMVTGAGQHQQPSVYMVQQQPHQQQQQHHQQQQQYHQQQPQHHQQYQQQQYQPLPRAQPPSYKE